MEIQQAIECLNGLLEIQEMPTDFKTMQELNIQALKMAISALQHQCECKCEAEACGWCEKADLGLFCAKADEYRASICFAGGNYHFPKNEQFKYCPECGRKLEDSQ